MREKRLQAHLRQIERLQRRIDTLKTQSDQFSSLRLAIMGIGILATLGAYFSLGSLGFWGFLIPTILIFGVVVAIHRRIQNSLSAHKVWQHIKQLNIARMRLDWEDIPQLLRAEKHPLEIDLDLRQVHRLIDTSTSRDGSLRLQGWLLTPHPDFDTIQKRQALIQEIIPMVIFRDRLILYANKTHHDGNAVSNWLKNQNEDPHLKTILRILWVLAGTTIVFFVPGTLGTIPPIWVASWLAYVGLFFSQWRNTSSLFQEALTLHDTLKHLSTIFAHLETYHYGEKENLKTLCSPILQDKPSQQLAKLAQIVSAVSLQGNPILWMVINVIVPWDVYFAYQLNQEKKHLAESLPRWLDVWYELEALTSLANFAYLNPEYTFPTFTNSENDIITTKNIGHPLIKNEMRVTNDFALDHLGEVIIITGSNMAGKSSFLRTLGVNLALAYAGSVVAAESLETRLFRVFSCIRVTDSLNDGISYFYAEVRRLKALLDALETPSELPLFFLIDEIFRGTNNRERLIGSQAYIQKLSGGQGVGLVATHDLELVRLADENPNITNYHFREEVTDGRMVFDYVLHAGPSPTTNALKIMALEGLPIEV